MSLTSREPSTKFYGPNRRYQPVPGNNVRVLAQVHNLQPGSAWIPALETELLTPHILTPSPSFDFYIGSSANFQWVMHWRFARTEFNVRKLPSGPFAFRFFPVFGVHKWCVNALTDAPGNYAFAGTATISWFEV